MRAVVYRGPHRVELEEVEEPRIEHPRDALVRITSAPICGTDLHIYHGRMRVEPGQIMGHEPLGRIVEVGGAVVSFQAGDRVTFPFSISCGHCANCLRGWPNACLTTRGSGFGLGRGERWGAQAELMRVPYADYNCIKLPGEPGDGWEDDFVMLSDIFPTGWHAAELARVKPGSSVAVFGAGPVGLLSAHSAILRGAGEVYVVDLLPDRLEKARQLGCETVNAGDGDPVEAIKEMRAARRSVWEAALPGEERMGGVMCGIDAVGFEALDRTAPSVEKPTQVIEDLVRLLNPTGTLALIGGYSGIYPEDGSGRVILPLGEIWAKKLAIGTGSHPGRCYAETLRSLIVSGRARPGFMVTHHLPLEEAVDAYRRYDARQPGYIKVILRPQKRLALNV
jgi:glutathione-independent formaldehyde dehydrogenase